MPSEKVNARDLIFEVSNMATPTPVWTSVAGITEAKVNFGENEESEETTTFDSDGIYEQEIMQRGASLTLSGLMLVDSTSGARDPGQAQMNTHAGAVGKASVVNVRHRYPLDTNWRVWAGTITRGEEGGGNNEKAGFEYTITRSGPATTMVVS